MHFFLAVAKLFSLLLSCLEARGKDQDSPPRAWSCTDKRRSFTIAGDNRRRMRRLCGQTTIISWWLAAWKGFVGTRNFLNDEAFGDEAWLIHFLQE